MATYAASGNPKPWPNSLDGDLVLEGIDAIDNALDGVSTQAAQNATNIATANGAISTLQTQVATLGGGAIDPVAQRAAIGAASVLMPPNPQAGAYTFAVSDTTGGTILSTAATAQTYTIPKNSTTALPAYCLIPIVQGGAGVITVVGATGVTLLAPPTGYTWSTSGQNSQIAAYQVSLDTWMVFGQLGTTIVTTPTTRYTDTWTGTNGAAWAGSWNTFTPASTTIDVQSNKGRFLNTTGANLSGPNAWLASVTPASDFNLSVDVFLMGTTTDQIVSIGGNSPYGYANNGGVDDGYFVELLPASSKFRLYGATAGTWTQVGTDQSFTYPAGATGVTVRLKKVGTALTVTIRNVGATEPTSGAGFFSTSDSGANSTLLGQPTLSSANGAPTTATTVSFDNLVLI